ncbi:hypothetical protein CHLRE_09g393953v5 [Chlamydomonas reinhardtii]|uniref:Uncharacterized protein n=1 Tax=Chlamydomonas reinhardtii TaxID=3055 RepID=A0A2K3DDB8_CHLRE|nr:uncharacterized protein CHLRE_09g393953v5 [Chlamydomonas reinhardtii]PNW78517.1 hypothetical protein CHLRE_09g393953v5 [Chlamydomonas reinhardtii]
MPLQLEHGRPHDVWLALLPLRRELLSGVTPGPRLALSGLPGKAPHPTCGGKGTEAFALLTPGRLSYRCGEWGMP